MYKVADADLSSLCIYAGSLQCVYVCVCSIIIIIMSACSS